MSDLLPEGKSGNTIVLLLPLCANVNNDSVAVCGNCIQGSSRADVACIAPECPQEALQERRTLQKKHC